MDRSGLHVVARSCRGHAEALPRRTEMLARTAKRERGREECWRHTREKSRGREEPPAGMLSHTGERGREERWRHA
jgi:hypothetical protein